MRLVHTWTFDLQEFDEGAMPGYAILSHTWEDGEVSYADMQHRDSARQKKGFKKIACAAGFAVEQGLRWLWVDTCCIDKSSSAELQEAINSMWRWYSNAVCCYVLLSDVPGQMQYLNDDGAWRLDKSGVSLDSIASAAMFEWFVGARWFSRGWCLQELIAPKCLLFYSFRSHDGAAQYIGDRNKLLKTISEATNIDIGVLAHRVPLSAISVAQRMSWAAKRQTRRVEDQAYSLLGIFDVSMPMLYGEGKRAFIRLQEEIMKTNSDHSLLAWGRINERSDGSLLASSPSDFADASRIVQCGYSMPFEMTNRGLRITLPLLTDELERREDLAILNCRISSSLDEMIALRLVRVPRTDEQHVAVSGLPIGLLDPCPSVGRRLSLVHAHEVRSATATALLIGRTFARDAANVRMMLHLDQSCADRAHDYVKDVYAEGDVTSPVLPMIVTTQKPIARAGVMLQYPSGRQFSLVFGFDRRPPDGSKGVLLPGIGLDSIRNIKISRTSSRSNACHCTEKTTRANSLESAAAPSCRPKPVWLFCQKETFSMRALSI